MLRVDSLQTVRLDDYIGISGKEEITLGLNILLVNSSVSMG